MYTNNHSSPPEAIIKVFMTFSGAYSFRVMSHCQPSSRCPLTIPEFTVAIRPFLVTIKLDPIRKEEEMANMRPM